MEILRYGFLFSFAMYLITWNIGLQIPESVGAGIQHKVRQGICALRVRHHRKPIPRRT